MNYPFAIVYRNKKTFQVMVLWAQSRKFKSEWMEAFNYIKTDQDCADSDGKSIDQ